MSIHFKRYCAEPTGNALTNSWGTSTYYLETNDDGNVLRQIEVYTNGRKLKYDLNNLGDEYGSLSDQSLDLIEFAPFKISASEFESIWK